MKKQILSAFVCLVKFCVNFSLEIKENFYENFLGENVRLTATFTRALHANSIIDCSILCVKDATCIGFNFRRNSADNCYTYNALYTDSPGAIQYELGTVYLEKTCARSRRISSADSLPKTNSHYHVKVTFENDSNLYDIAIPTVFSGDPAMLSVGTISDATDSKLSRLDSSVVADIDNVMVNFYFAGGNVGCFKGSISCSGTWPIALHSLLPSSVAFDAILPLDHNFANAYAFNGKYVYQIHFDHYQTWELDSTRLMQDESKWRGAPHNIKAAAWINRNGLSLLDTSKAILFSDRNLYVYDENSEKIVYNRLLCEL